PPGAGDRPPPQWGPLSRPGGSGRTVPMASAVRAPMPRGALCYPKVSSAPHEGSAQPGGNGALWAGETGMSRHRSPPADRLATRAEPGRPPERTAGAHDVTARGPPGLGGPCSAAQTWPDSPAAPPPPLRLPPADRPTG